MENEYKRKPKRASGAGLDHLLVPENELATERNQSLHHTVQLEKRASLFTTA